MLKASLPQMAKNSSLRCLLDQKYYAIKENVVKNGDPIIDVCTGAPPDVVTALFAPLICGRDDLQKTCPPFAQ